MIVGVDHITYSDCFGSNFKLLLEENGYTCRFCEEFDENIRAKKVFMKTEKSKHRLNFLTKGESIPLELIEYDEIHGVSPVTYDYEKSEISYPVLASDINEEIRFLNQLDFKVYGEGGGFFSLQYKSVFNKSSLKIKLIEEDVKIEDRFIDSKGFGVIALQTTKIDKTLSKFPENGLSADQFFVDGKEYNISFLRSPSGLFIELIEPKRGKK